MLNKDGQRELAYVAKITKIEPIEKADNIELVEINGGWYCIAKKGEFQDQDLCVYFEIDSKLPETDWSEFLAPKHYKVKTMKLSKFGVISQGLALPFDAFGWEKDKYAEGKFLTKELNVTYSVEEDNKRKAPSVDKYKRMASRHPKVFSKPFVQKIYKTKVGKRVLYVFFGGKGKYNDWPVWVKKTDEERIENLPWLLRDKEMKWYATEKVDGTSTTFTIKRGGFLKQPQFLVCSRNVVFNKPEKNCYYDTNVYLEMAKKYDIESVLNKILFFDKSLNFVTIQGETYGANIQKRDYSQKGHDFAIFNVILGYRTGETVRLNPEQMKDFMDQYNLPCVPILNKGDYILPNTIDELREYVNSEGSKIDNKMREGIVFRSHDGKQSFKCVSPEYLIKYHG